MARRFRFRKSLGKNGAVIAFTSTTCPVSKRYAPGLARLEGLLREKGIALVLVDPFASDAARGAARDDEEPRRHLARHARSRRLGGARRCKGGSSAEVFLIDATRTLLYRGALDDQYGLNYSQDAPKLTYLLDAVEEMLAGRKVSIAATSAPGCELEAPALDREGDHLDHLPWRGRAHPAAELRRVPSRGRHRAVLARDAGRREGAGEDDQTRGGAGDHAAVVCPARRKPASPRRGRTIARSRPTRRRRCSPGSTRRTAPKGNAGDAPKPIKWLPDWTLGQPDAVLTFAKPVAVKAEGTMRLRQRRGADELRRGPLDHRGPGAAERARRGASRRRLHHEKRGQVAVEAA